MAKEVNHQVILVHLTLLVICIFCNDTCGLEAGLVAYENASFSVPFDCALCDPKFNHFVVHTVTGDIYLGASNSLVRLDSTYENNQTIVTRVECVDLDIEDCINHNKLLAIHYGTDTLITCGSLNGGTCQIIDSDDILMSTEYDISVVASGERSTVYIIAPGKVSSNGATEDMLYVGATDPEKRDVPVLSRRRLEMENTIFSIPNGQMLPLSPAAPIDFRIDFVYTFTNDSFTYFLTNQRYDIDEQDPSKLSEIISKVYRVCHDYHNFDSFTNINMECQSKTGEVYNLAQAAFIGTAGPVLADTLGVNPKENVLFALFSKGVESTSHTPTNHSALCIFKLDDIQKAFIRAIATCFESRDNNEAIQFLPGSNCNLDAHPNDSLRYARLQECQAINYALARSKEGEAEVSTAIMEWQDTPVSSIITSTEQNHTIAFIGTTSGNLMKVHIDDKRVYETLSLGSPVLKDVTLDEENQHLTVLTEKKVFKLLVENCGYYSTCEECIGVTDDDGDPYCGWCTLQRECTRQHECPMPDVSTRWLSYNEAQCSGISKVIPYDSQPITVQQQITVTVEQLPDLDNGEQYQCVFELNDEMSLESSATKSGNDLNCMTPSTEMLPGIPTGDDHVTMLLSIRSTETGVKFVDTNHTFYECTTHTRCIDCASSSWDCDWCTYGNVCTHDKANCPDDTDNTLIAGEKHHRANPSRRGPSECAQLEEHGEEVLLSVGVQRDINIAVKNLPDISQVPASSYTCIVYIEGKHQEANAERIRDTVRCNSTFTYQADSQELTANLTLQWTWEGTRRTIDDEFGFQVTLFKCEILRPDCSRCVSKNTTRHELRCGWCSESQVCAVEDDPQCTGPWIREVPDSGVESKNCPRPKFSIWPSSGPIEGNTLLEISGTNLGRDFSSIKNVTVADRECRHADLAHMYELGERIFCVTTMSDVVTPGDVFVTVAGIDGNDQMNDGGTTFTYTDPKIEEFNPTYGPRAGGTLVNINGKSLRTGRDIEIQIGNATCFYDRFSMNDEEVNCSTDESFEGNVAPITMTFDGSMRLSEDEYRYRGDPDVNSVRPTEAFEAGGRALTVTGINLDVVQTPRILVRLGDTEYKEVCTVENENPTVMTCPSPAVNFASRRRRQAEEAESASVGFIMDGVRDLRMWSENENRSFAFEYYQNPNYFNFLMNISVAENELQIEGERLNLASDESDVTVYLGDLKCEVTSLGFEVLICRIPAEVGNYTTDNNTVYVTINQGNLNFKNIGSINFIPLPPPPPPPPPPGIIIGVAVVAFVLLVLIIILTVVFRSREKRAIEQTKKLLNEMEKLEDSMAGRIRDAFAQLQLDLQDLTSDLEGTGMPFVTHAQYATKMLFAGINTKPSTADPIGIDDRKERAMAEFCRLLEDKNFLLAFIRVLDEPRSAPVPVIRERTKFACFLTTLMILEDKLPYLTDVMLTVLKEHINEAVEDDKELQLCQRTETVGERLLTNWVSVCLFKYLKDQAAFPLFVLYRAILLQTEKGPVDIVTGKAYYSLSEHYVLTLDNIEYQTLTLKVVINEGDGESKELKVTNQDTVSQVKEKILDLIYRNKAYSERPDVALVDLEWRQGRAGRLILRDDDQTTIKDDEFKKINTLEHYKIPDGANVALVLKQNVPNGAVDPAILRTSIFVRGEEDEDEGEDEQTVQVRRPRVSLFHKRDRARYTVYELDNIPMDDPDRNLKVYHLEREEELEDFQISNRKSWADAKKRLSRRVSDAIRQRKTNIRKIHYPQLLTTKGATQQFVDHMFKAVLDKDHVPKTIKYMFDFLEVEARRHNITETGTIHKWKSNCLPLRFWVTIINNPQFIFDIRESRSVTSSMNVVGQAFFDAFNRTDYQHSKETTFNKLLYHRELDGFQESVDNYYDAVRELPKVDATEMAEELDMISQQFTGVFSRMSTLMQLYNFAQINNDKLIEALEEDESCRKAQLAYKLESIAAILEGETV